MVPMVFCCIAAWIQPYQSDCLHDFLLSIDEVGWESFGHLSSTILKRSLEKTLKIVQDKCPKLSKPISSDNRKSSKNQICKAWPGPVCNRMLCCIIGHFFGKIRCNDIDISGNAGQLLLYFVQQLKLPFPASSVCSERAPKN